jgi:hypothetical protein
MARMIKRRDKIGNTMLITMILMGSLSMTVITS